MRKRTEPENGKPSHFETAHLGTTSEQRVDTVPPGIRIWRAPGGGIEIGLSTLYKNEVRKGSVLMKLVQLIMLTSVLAGAHMAANANPGANCSAMVKNCDITGDCPKNLADKRVGQVFADNVAPTKSSPQPASGDSKSTR
ncbi:MAG: hypothetical protein HC902_03805 [Calothrix sp. SM1_5_4]|nr:hypothetical protein [Calothrix sp. SM1_5_4]